MADATGVVDGEPSDVEPSDAGEPEDASRDVESVDGGGEDGGSPVFGWLDLVTDRDTEYEVPDIPRPDYLVTFVDPNFGTRVTRIAGDVGSPIINKDGENIGTWGNAVRHWYSKAQAWNADETLLYLFHNEGGSPREWGLLLDGQTYEPVSFPNLPAARVRWHPTNPDLMIFGRGSDFGFYNVVTDETTVLRSFPEYDLGLSFMGEGNVSHDGRMVVLHGQIDDGSFDIFAYDMIDDVVYPSRNSFDMCGNRSFDWASITPSGEYVYIAWTDAQQYIYDLSMNEVTVLDTPIKHVDIGFDEDGNEVAVGASDDRYPCWDTSREPVLSSYRGEAVKIRLSDGLVTPIQSSGRYAISHTSMRNIRRPNWAYNWYVAAPYTDEIVAHTLDGSDAVERFCHMHNNEVDYRSEAHPSPSPTGQRVVFASNWNDPTGRPISAYVVDARDL